MRQITKLLKALSDESRIRVLNLLVERECCVCEVMQAMRISQSKASRTLTALYDVGILKQRKDGRWVLYSIDSDRMEKYLNDIVQAVLRSLGGNPVLSADRGRLKTAERVGPTCVSETCQKRWSAEAP